METYVISKTEYNIDQNIQHSKKVSYLNEFDGNL